MEHFSYKCGCSIHVLRLIKEELVWAIHKRFHFISNTMFLNCYTTKEPKNKAVFSLKQYCMHCYVVISNVTFNKILFLDHVAM